MQPNTSIALAVDGDDNKVRSAPIDCFRFAERPPTTFWAEGALRQIAAVSAATLLAFAATGVSAQNAAQNAIDRSLLLRQQQQQDLQNRLDDATRNAMPAVPAQPPAGAGGSLTPPQLPPAQLPPADLESQQLYQSQQQRLLQQQIQNRSLPAPVQEQQNRMQLQQFQREDQAQRLQRDIQRNSNPALPGRH